MRIPRKPGKQTEVDWAEDTAKVIDSVTGAIGSGKSYLSSWNVTLQILLTTKYIRLPKLLSELAIARGKGKFRETMKQYQKYTLLILNEWLLVKLTETEARNLLEIIHVWYHKASTVFCSRFAPTGWCNKFLRGRSQMLSLTALFMILI